VDFDIVPGRPVLYAFQHVTLPEAAFQNHPELIRELAGGRPLGGPLVRFQGKAHIRCAAAGLIDGTDDEADLFEPVAIHPRKRSGFTAYVVTMPVPESSPEAHFVAIVHKDDEAHEYMRESPSTRYFTLEKSDISDRPMLCEWRRDGSHANHGEGPAPNLEAFAHAVFERVLTAYADRELEPSRPQEGKTARPQLADPSPKQEEATPGIATQTPKCRCCGGTQFVVEAAESVVLRVRKCVRCGARFVVQASECL
jgi:hypothetical protein